MSSTSLVAAPLAPATPDTILGHLAAHAIHCRYSEWMPDVGLTMAEIWPAAQQLWSNILLATAGSDGHAAHFGALPFEEYEEQILELVADRLTPMSGRDEDDAQRIRSRFAHGEHMRNARLLYAMSQLAPEGLAAWLRQAEVLTDAASVEVVHATLEFGKGRQLRIDGLIAGETWLTLELGSHATEKQRGAGNPHPFTVERLAELISDYDAVLAAAGAAAPTDVRLLIVAPRAAGVLDRPLSGTLGASGRLAPETVIELTKKPGSLAARCLTVQLVYYTTLRDALRRLVFENGVQTRYGASAWSVLRTMDVLVGTAA